MKKLFGTIVAIILIAGVAYAHGGMEHIMGTVVSMTDNSITVKTMAGKTQTVSTTADTKYTQMDKPVAMKDLKEGDRVVIEVAKKDGKLIAVEVKVGMAGMKGMHGDMSRMSMDQDGGAIFAPKNCFGTRLPVGTSPLVA
jgi:Cu/Ag efflux protein CusF